MTLKTSKNSLVLDIFGYIIEHTRAFKLRLIEWKNDLENNSVRFANLYNSMLIQRTKIDNIFLVFLEIRIWHFMQIDCQRRQFAWNAKTYFLG